MKKSLSKKVSEKVDKKEGVKLPFTDALLDIAVCKVNKPSGRVMWKDLHNSPNKYYIFEEKMFTSVKTDDVMFVITYYKNLDLVDPDDSPGNED